MINDLTIYQNLPKEELVKNFPKANTSWHDERFDAYMLRVTDPTTADGKKFSTASAGQVNSWNTDSTMFWLTREGNVKVFFQFDKKLYAATKIDFTLTGQICFSRTVVNRCYQLDGTQLRLHTFKKEKGVWVHNDNMLLFDFAKLLPAGFKPSWVSNLMCSADDQNFAVGFSEDVQNTGHFVCTFRRGTNGSIFDTQLYNPPFLLHSVYQTPNPNYVVVGGAAPSGVNLMWDLPSNKKKQIVISGHAVNTLDYYYAGGPGNGQWGEVPLQDVAKSPRMIIPKVMLPNPPVQVDKHGSYNACRLGNSFPFVVSLINKGTIVDAAWEGEIITVNPATGNVHRLCQHSSLSTNPNFNTANAIAIQSQDGKYVLYCSDLMGGIEGDAFIVQVV